MSAKRRPGAGVRAAAARALVEIIRGRTAAEDALAAQPVDLGRDAPLLSALVYGALRWHHRLEWQTQQLLTRPLKNENDDLAALLRVGLLQLQHMRIPEHAAVSATVDAAAELGHREAGGLVNAVLRRFQRERNELDRRSAEVREAWFSHPAWLIDSLERDWPSDWRRILEQNNLQAPMWLRVNLRKVRRDEYLARLAAAGIAATPGPSSTTAVLLAEPQPAESLPGFGAGEVSVQDAAAQLAVGYLQPEPGQRVLDACAAPGGKTGHILEACPRLAALWAVDRDAVRLTKVGENLSRLGLQATLVHGDAADPTGWWDGEPFDRVLIDAPCSATGVIRRHPDIKVLRRPEDVRRAAALQGRLLEALWRTLKPGGRLVYVTCSVLKQENDEQLLRFLSNNPDAELSNRDAIGTAAGRQTLPGEANMDGFYYACADKPVRSRSSRVRSPQQ